MHWHAHAVQTLAFSEESNGAPYLISGGLEAVLVQWHLDKQDKTFVARVGNAISKISLSKTFYSLVLSDNTFKVVRFDNNKAMISKQGPALGLGAEAQLRSVTSPDGAHHLTIPTGSAL